MNKIRTYQHWFFYLLFIASLVLSWYFHKDSARFNNRNELWSDRAGYYIYLPATFFYHFDARKMPSDLDIRTGGGFSLDSLKNKIDTKYTYGVALMLSPFFLSAHLISLITGFDDENGFSMIYMRMMALAGVVYLILGLWLLHRFLIGYFPAKISLFVVFIIFSATNLFYYSLIDGMMSHVYSFFLFALFLFSLRNFQISHEYRFFLLICLSLAVAILIRPTNILPGLCLFFWDAGSRAGVMRRFKQFMQPRYWLTFPAILFLIFLPQLIYWKYLSGNFLHFSYRDEGFSNLRNPRIAEVLFSPLNGLMAYTPLVILMVAGILIMFIQKKQNRWLVASLFILVTMVCASWKMWYFGCSYGQRSFIEYYTILAVPLAWLITKVFNSRFLLVKTILFFLIFFLIYSNLRYTVGLYRFDRCYYGSTWDWDYYLRSFERAGVISQVHQIKTYKNDFENLALCPVVKPSQIFTRSGQYSIPCDKKSKKTLLYSARLYEFKSPLPKIMDVDVWMLSPGRRVGNAALSCNFIRNNIPVFDDRKKLTTAVTAPLMWTMVSKTFIIPDVNDSSILINLFIDNPDGSLLYFDDLSIRFRYNWKMAD
ncbi:MAG: hypothetical protein NT004_05910 [Bacteroidetes bacterium]|nr:hypothetical protein [Bacteroidota bacterium]